MKYWHYFYVSDYKGGKLHYYTNLSAKGLVEAMVERDWDWEIFENYGIELDENTLENVDPNNPVHRTLLVSIFDAWFESEANGDIYAGYSGRTFPKVFYTDSEGKLEQGFPDDDVVVEVMLNHLKSYLDGKAND